MANQLNSQIVLDGRENSVIKINGILDTSDLAQTVIADPATLSDIGPFVGLKATGLRIKRLDYNVEDTLAAYLYWDATAPVFIGQFAGRGLYNFMDVGGLQNNAGAGKTGKILLATQGWATSAILSFTLTLYLGKQ